MKFLGACCTVKNEASIIHEWMAFHRAAGVEKLIIINNGSDDDTADIVRSFIDQDSVDLID
ncbi:MAG: glycosyltransferase family 2 protein [Nitrospiraceae bacterium]|nr:glycosyltransferase family 2 protein [Nitrospiraceae bacterium]